MVIDITEKIRKNIDHDVLEAIEHIWMYNKFFGRETFSAALGEISEHIVAKFVGGRRVGSGNRGYDVVGENEEKYEVKSRIEGNYKDSVQFNFRNTVNSGTTVFCFKWDYSTGSPKIKQVLKLPSDYLKILDPKKYDKHYYARVSWAKLAQGCSTFTES